MAARPEWVVVCNTAMATDPEHAELLERLRGLECRLRFAPNADADVVLPKQGVAFMFLTPDDAIGGREREGRGLLPAAWPFRYRTLKKRFVSTVLVMLGDYKAADRGGAAQAAHQLPALLHAVDRVLLNEQLPTFVARTLSDDDRFRLICTWAAMNEPTEVDAICERANDARPKWDAMQQDAVAQRLLATWTGGAHCSPAPCRESLLDVVLDALEEPLSNPSDIQDWTWRHDLATYLSADHAV